MAPEPYWTMSGTIHIFHPWAELYAIHYRFRIRRTRSTNLMRFSELGLSAEILRAVNEQGYETATPIQQQAIPKVLQGSDLVG